MGRTHVPWPLLGAAAVWLAYPAMQLVDVLVPHLPGHWAGHVVLYGLLGAAAGALAAGVWTGVRVLRRLDPRSQAWAGGAYGVLALLCLVMMPAVASDGPPQGGPEAILDGTFLLLPLVLAFAATAAGLLVPLIGTWRWLVVVAAAAAGPAAFVVALGQTDLAFFHNTRDVLILVLMPGFLPAGIAVAAMAGERDPVRPWAATAGFLAPWLAWGTLVLVWDGRSWTSGLPLAGLVALAVTAGWRGGPWVALAVVLASFPIWMLQCMWTCDFPT